MIGVRWTGGPGRVDELVMQPLLHILDDPALGIEQRLGEQTNPCRLRDGDRFMAGPHRRQQIASEQIDERASSASVTTLDDSVAARRGSQSGQAPTLAHQQMVAAHEPAAQQTAGDVESERCLADRAAWRKWRDVHGARFSWMKRGLRCTSSCTSGASIQVKLWTSPALMTKISPAPASNVWPFTVHRPRPCWMNCTSS